jgi:hypothetical protein
MKNCKYKSVISQDKFEVIHHLYSFNKIISETLEILDLPIYEEINFYSNTELEQIINVCLDLHYKYGLGVCLTEEEHSIFHKIYGRDCNTPEQFEEYIKLKKSQTA